MHTGSQISNTPKISSLVQIVPLPKSTWSTLCHLIEEDIAAVAATATLGYQRDAVAAALLGHIALP